MEVVILTHPQAGVVAATANTPDAEDKLLALTGCDCWEDAYEEEYEITVTTLK